MSFDASNAIDDEVLQKVAMEAASHGRTEVLVETLIDCGEADVIAKTICKMEPKRVFAAIRECLWEQMCEEREQLASAAAPNKPKRREGEPDNRSFRPRRIRQILVDGGDIEVAVRVSADDVKEAWECFSEFLEPMYISDYGWSDDEVRVACGAFWALTRAMPAMSHDWAMWLVRTQCPASISHVMKEELDLVSQNDEWRQKLLGRVRQLDAMLEHRKARYDEAA